MVETAFFGANLRLARNFQARTLQEVATHLDVSRQFVYMLEAGKAAPKPDFVDALAGYLQVLPAFFYQSVPSLISEDQCHFRGNITSRVAIRQVTLAKGEIFGRLVRLLDSKLELPELSVPHIEVTSIADIENAAEKCRREWSLGLGPIENMVRLVENKGIVVTTFRNISREIDAMSISSNPPVIVANKEGRSGCRVRFDLGHEVGHLVMHVGRETGDRATEGEANRFAGAFLMPRSTFLNEFPVPRSGRMRWRSLSELKLRWKVSKSALIYRAKQLGLLSDDQYRSGVIFLTRHGEARIEAEDDQIGIEQPELFNNAVRCACDHYKVSVAQLGQEIGVRESVVAEFLDETFVSGAIRNTSAVIDLAQYRARVHGYDDESSSPWLLSG